jgi:hypothetical protein
MESRDINEQWRQEMVSALKVFYYYLANAEQDLMLGILHPGGGQYYCLSILDSRQVLLHMNRNASATAFYPASFVVRDFAEKAQKNSEKVAASLFAGSKMEYAYGSINPSRGSKLRMVAHMIGLLEELIGQDVDLLWGYFDSDNEGTFSNFDVFPSNFPEDWETAQPVNSQNYDWSANILQIVAGGQIVATYNQQTAEVLLSAGTLKSF